MNELQKLSRKLDIDHAARIELEIAAALALVKSAAELALDSILHRADRLGDLFRVVRRAVDRVLGEASDLGTECRIAGDRAQLDQRLSFPQPRFLLVIAAERLQR